ncbi:DUF4375 domain-containing protein [Agrobacterium tumefaciens]|uniref:DUF4375 domain-containing protein n=1 Tax=Agrobacterium tumefaciens TaxID=358 RepID=A0A546Y7L6_AGRTU|nr:DUF4375 domain-containing protein [Agrobacterium tumefaciens]TRB08997.1 DUF4375 domain-containing protein [Agrobacterium tumefaciens]
MKFYMNSACADDDKRFVETFFDYIYIYIERKIYNFNDSISDIRCVEVDIARALRYEGEVNNGGHNQYINNLDGNQTEMAIALDGLTLLGAERQVNILREMIRWTKANPKEVYRMLSTDDYIKQPLLESLDDDLFSIPSELSVRQHAANWLRKNGNFVYVTEEQYEEIRQRLFTSGLVN